MADPVTSASPDAANEIDVSQQLDDRSPILGPDCGDGEAKKEAQKQKSTYYDTYDPRKPLADHWREILGGSLAKG
ncbi:MAG: hypothetical protein L6R41_001660 [Letrouitia leprolyta]|nr:MAG: hypothetical protein L6R41_001660 [Letrouitia leprolyta]